MPYCQIEFVARNCMVVPSTDLTKNQSILIKLDSQKFRNISPEKAEGRSSNWCFEVAI